MTNRIRWLEIRQRLPDPTEPEVWVIVEPERVTATTEVVGRLQGPRCRFSNTVEVAYPLRPFARVPEGLPGLPRRIVIPEASLWEPECPFLYQGPVELWEEGRPCDRRQVSLGLRTMTLGPRGLRINGKPFTLRGVECGMLSAAEALALRDTNHNALVVPVAPETAKVWEMADELGFLVLGRLNPSEETLRLAHELREHPSVLGWLVEPSDAELPTVRAFAGKNRGAVFGVMIDEPPTKLPEGTQLLVCDEGMAAAMQESPLPRLILGHGAGFPENSADVIFLPPGTIGWVRT